LNQYPHRFVAAGIFLPLWWHGLAASVFSGVSKASKNSFRGAGTKLALPVNAGLILVEETSFG